MSNLALVVKDLRKAFNAFDINKAKNSSEDEAKTRTYLVEPFFDILRYSRGYDDGCLVPEYSADFANLKGRRVDYAILFKKKPEIIIEVKKASDKLTDLKHLRQLNQYFNHTNDSKIGILTNGLEYQFYCRKADGGPNLHPTPFFVVNIESIEGSIEKLARYHATVLDIKSIIEEAQDLFFLESFESALFDELRNPSKDLIKAIFARMGGQRLTSSVEIKIKGLINSLSLKSALDKLIIDESTRTNSGIITTSEELEIFHVIKTILAHNKNIPSSSVTYKDQKGKFSIILDNNSKKKVCDLFLSDKFRRIEIGEQKFDIPDHDSIMKLKKLLTDQALSQLSH